MFSYASTLSSISNTIRINKFSHSLPNMCKCLRKNWMSSYRPDNDLLKKYSTFYWTPGNRFHLYKISPVIKGKNILKHADTALIYSRMIDLNYKSVESNQMFFLLKKSGCSYFKLIFHDLNSPPFWNFFITLTFIWITSQCLILLKDNHIYIKYVVFEVFFTLVPIKNVLISL